MYSAKPQKSALHHVLLALIPYSHDNMKLAFAPNKFFYELANTTRVREDTLRTAFSRGKKRGLILRLETSQMPSLSALGLRQIQPFIAKKLDKKAKLMVIFDVPEYRSGARKRLRTYLKIWHFEQIQKSVWMTDLDYSESLTIVIKELELDTCVELYECAKVISSS